MLAQNDTLLKDIHFQYAGGDSPHFSIDRLSATDSEILYYSDDGHGRIFLNDQEYGFKAISSTIVAAALRNGDSLSMKPYLFAEMIDYMLGITTITSLREAFTNFDATDDKVFPNPASSQTNISFNIKQSSLTSLSIVDQNGSSIYSNQLGYLDSGLHTIKWDLMDNNGVKVTTGNYFYQIQTNVGLRFGKIIVVR